MTEETIGERKKWIDEASHEKLLRLWRNAPSGSPMFQGETGAYYAKVMAERKEEVGNSAHVAASKSIDWRRS